MATGYYNKHSKIKSSRTVVCKHEGQLGNILIPHQYQDFILELGLLPAKQKVNLCLNPCPHGNKCFPKNKSKRRNYNKRAGKHKTYNRIVYLRGKYEYMRKEENHNSKYRVDNNIKQTFKKRCDFMNYIINAFPENLYLNWADRKDVVYWLDALKGETCLSIFTNEQIVLSLMLFTQFKWKVFYADDIPICQKYGLTQVKYHKIVNLLMRLGVIS